METFLRHSVDHPMFSILCKRFLLVVDSSTTTSSNEQVFTDIVGTILSPNYPRNYGNSETMNYIVKAETGKEIVLIFDTFDVEYESDCWYDFLKASRRHFSIRLNFSNILISISK